MRVSIPATFLKTLITLIAVMTVLTPFAFSQIDTGAIVGTVRDPSGAAVPNATVTVTNTATGVSQSTTTNASGEYQFTEAQTRAARPVAGSTRMRSPPGDTVRRKSRRR